MSPSLARLIVVESSAVAGAGRCRGDGVRKCLDRRDRRPNRSRGVRVTQNVTAARCAATNPCSSADVGLLSAFGTLWAFYTEDQRGRMSYVQRVDEQSGSDRVNERRRPLVVLA